jgi:hypothetical protein
MKGGKNERGRKGLVGCNMAAKPSGNNDGATERKEKITLVFSYEHDCEPVSLVVITGSVMQYVVLCLR